MTSFDLHGQTYRTNADASRVERLDGSTWTPTGSLRVVLAARDAVANPCPGCGYTHPKARCTCPACNGDMSGWTLRGCYGRELCPKHDHMMLRGEL